jgi:hypothetical protein
MIDIIRSYIGIPVIRDHQTMTRILNDTAGTLLAQPPAHFARAARAQANMGELTNAVSVQIAVQEQTYKNAPSAPAQGDDGW